MESQRMSYPRIAIRVNSMKYCSLRVQRHTKKLVTNQIYLSWNFRRSQLIDREVSIS